MAFAELSLILICDVLALVIRCDAIRNESHQGVLIDARAEEPSGRRTACHQAPGKQLFNPEGEK